MTSDEDLRWALTWALVIGAGAVAETIALRGGKPQAPLSHYLRRVLGVRGNTHHQRAGQVALGASLVWLLRHLYDDN